MSISSSDFSGKKVIEIGPGTGQNSLHIASLKPAMITLVEPNPTGVKGITELIDKYPSEQKYVKLEYSSIE
jgi:predicted O-methyltransferase YrrM